jgi:hypothetical protein
MKIPARLLLIGVILAFAAGSVVHAADMSGMNANMAAMTDGMAPDCNGCGGEGDNGSVEKACPDVCVTPAVAVLPAATTIAARDSGDAGFHVAGLIVGPSGPPDPYPPKPALN